MEVVRKEIAFEDFYFLGEFLQQTIVQLSATKTLEIPPKETSLLFSWTRKNLWKLLKVKGRTDGFLL